MVENEPWTMLIAAYAAIVATGALALEIRRWLESGTRLSISVMPEAQIATPGIGVDKTQNYLVATVHNRGDAPTTITHFGLVHFKNNFGKLINKPIWSGYVLRPEPPGSDIVLPKFLGPGEIWSGMVNHDEDLLNRINSGFLFVAIYGSHSRKPTLKKVRRLAVTLKNAEKI